MIIRAFSPNKFSIQLNLTFDIKTSKLLVDGNKEVKDLMIDRMIETLQKRLNGTTETDKSN